MRRFSKETTWMRRIILFFCSTLFVDSSRVDSLFSYSVCCVLLMEGNMECCGYTDNSKELYKKDDICSHIAEILHAHEDSYYFFILSKIHRKQVYIVQNHIIKDSTMDFYESERSSVS